MYGYLVGDGEGRSCQHIEEDLTESQDTVSADMYMLGVNPGRFRTK